MKLKIIVTICMLKSLAFGWYPDYTVMATDFALRYDFLAPTRISSIGLQGLGPQFLKLYSDPLDNIFQNPAYLHFAPSHYIYFDVAGEEYKPDLGVIPAYPILDYASSIYPYPYYWSPYRYTIEPSAEEPLMRTLYFGKPLGERFPLGLGAGYEYFYAQEKFYQPYWYWWGARAIDAYGVALEDAAMDPYEDYRIVEQGDNVARTDGHRFTTFLSYPLLKHVTIGARYTFRIENSGGSYQDLDLRDKSNWADEYLSFYDTQKNLDKSYRLNDAMFGVIYDSNNDIRLGVSLGRSNGFTDRSYAESDTSHYKSVYLHPDTSKTNRYTSKSGYHSEKWWKYDGSSDYGEVHGDIPFASGILLRFSLYGEKRLADLKESEEMRRHQSYASKYWNDYDSVLYVSNFSSSAELDRTGTGTYTFSQRKATLGVDWEISPTVRFVGGVTYDSRTMDRSAREPFIGLKYSFRHYKGYHWVDYDTREETQEDEKEFKWWRSEDYITLALPLGVIVGFAKHFEFRLGLTKVMQKTDIAEGYDLIVFKDKNAVMIDGVTTITEDSLYVEGHDFPGTHTFTDEIQMRAAITVRYQDRFRLTAAVSESLLEPRSLKIGAVIVW